MSLKGYLLNKDDDNIDYKSKYEDYLKRYEEEKNRNKSKLLYKELNKYGYR